LGNKTTCATYPQNALFWTEWKKKRNGLNEIEFERIIKMETMMLMMVMKK